MIYELRTYTLQPGKQGEYLKLNAEIGRKIRGDKYGKLEGYWSTEFGDAQPARAPLELRRPQRARAAARRAGQGRGVDQGVRPEIRPMMLAQENKILSRGGAVDAARGHRQHLRAALVPRARRPGGRVARAFKAMLPFRDKYTRRVGLWQTEAGQLNEVVHMWVYRDLNERAAARAKMRRTIRTWQAFLGKSAPLLRHHAGHRPHRLLPMR